MLSNLKVRTGLMLAQLAVVAAALVAIVLGWSSMQSSAEAINDLDRLSVRQSSLIKDVYTQMLRATIRADIAAAQRQRRRGGRRRELPHRAGTDGGREEEDRRVQEHSQADRAGQEVGR